MNRIVCMLVASILGTTLYCADGPQPYEEAVPQILIRKPYCRHRDFSGATEAQMIDSFCTGTVIAQRDKATNEVTGTYLLTAAHCLTTDCPEDRDVRGSTYDIQMSDIRIPRVPTADMTNFDWKDPSKTLSPVNVVFAPGYSEVEMKKVQEYFQKLKDPTLPIRNISYPFRSDMAIMDFGNDLKQYSNLNFRAIKDFSNDLIQYSNPNWDLRMRLIKNAMARKKDVRFPFIAYSFWENGYNPKRFLRKIKYSPRLTHWWTQFGPLGLISQFNSGPTSTTSFGCLGDSGAPLLYQAQVGEKEVSPPPVVIGVMSTLFSVHQGDQLCPDVRELGYAPSDPALIDEMINKLKAERENGNPISIHTPINPLTGNPIMISDENEKKYPASVSNVHTLSSGITSEVWTTVPFPSYIAGGKVDMIPAIGSGTRTATWVVTNLIQGYYRVEFMYPMRKDNATCVQVSRRVTGEPNYIVSDGKILFPLYKPIDQSGGTKIKISAYTSATSNPAYGGVSNATRYIWVPNKGNVIGSGVLGIRLSDAGCGSPSAPDGNMIADSIQLTLMGTQK